MVHEINSEIESLLVSAPGAPAKLRVVHEAPTKGWIESFDAAATLDCFLYDVTWFPPYYRSASCGHYQLTFAV